MNSLKKALKYFEIYGIPRTLFKIFGRKRLPFVKIPSFGKKDVAIIGCGQFGFSTIGYFISMNKHHSFVRAYDVDDLAKESFEYFFSTKKTKNIDEIFNDNDVKYVYIASSHSSHAEYAIKCIEKNKIVYIEKPISVNFKQILSLSQALKNSSTSIYAGYNRPYSKAITILRSYFKNSDSPITLSCFVSGHSISQDHWYRLPSEGTRICGNVGHWLDLAIHILMWGELPDLWDINVIWSNKSSPDDDLTIVMVSERGDLVNITLTSRGEPFEGINETINFQCGGLIAKIDDFRRMDVWNLSIFKRYNFWPKDVGHKRAINQPFDSSVRNWSEVEMSTLLMLTIADMVRSKINFKKINLSDLYSQIETLRD